MVQKKEEGRNHYWFILGKPDCQTWVFSVRCWSFSQCGHSSKHSICAVLHPQRGQNIYCSVKTYPLELFAIQRMSYDVTDIMFSVFLCDLIVIQLLSHVWLFSTPQIAAHQASLSPRACSNLCPLSQWCHPTTSTSVSPFSSCPQSFPASKFFPVSWLFASGSQSIGAPASASVLKG